MKIRASSKPERDPANRYILGIDSSTQGVAWTLIDLGRPTHSGKIDLTKIKEMDDMMSEICQTFPKVLEDQTPDHIFIEMPIFVANPATARKLTFIVGCLLTVAIQQGYETTLVEPATWKSYIGYFNLSSKFQAEAKLKLGKTEGKKLCDFLRKEQTRRIVKRRFDYFEVEDHDITDACAIGLYGANKLSVEILFEKNKETALPLADLAALGLVL